MTGHDYNAHSDEQSKETWRSLKPSAFNKQIIQTLLSSSLSRVLLPTHSMSLQLETRSFIQRKAIVPIPPLYLVDPKKSVIPVRGEVVQIEGQECAVESVEILSGERMLLVVWVEETSPR